ncbi:MAG: radical SAM protein, partial [Bacilli bacterium]|nr:radical SAM protein [Bacilli bacterium]
MECMFRIPKDGGKVLWEITNQCNYACKYCIFNCNYMKDENELNTMECLKVIDELKENGYKYIKITGGEPFIRPDLLQIINYGISKGMIIDVSTNASLLTDKLVSELENND